MVERFATGTGTAVEKDADVGLEDGAKGLEEPAMRVDFLLILLFETEYHLTRHDALFGATNLLEEGTRLHGGKYRNWRDGSILI